MPFAIKGRIDGLEGLVKSIGYLKQSTQNRIMRPGVAAAGRQLAKRAKAKVKRVKGSTTDGWRYTGLLAKSLGAVVKTGKKAVYAIIGPRRGFKVQVGVVTRGKNAGKPVFHDPANIAHLVEFGHGGPHPAPPHPFLRPAYEEGKAEARKTIADKAREAMARIFAKAARQGKVAA